MDGWETSFILERRMFRGYVSFQRGNIFPDIQWHPLRTKNKRRVVGWCSQDPQTKTVGKVHVFYIFHSQPKGSLKMNDKITPRKFNIAPERWFLEDYFPIGKVTFQVLC